MVAITTGSLHGASGLPEVKLTVRSMSGSEIAVIVCAPGDTVYDVKSRLAKVNGDLRSHQYQLVADHCVMKDCDPLPESKAALTVNCVRIPPSSLAAYLQEHGNMDDEGLPALHESESDMIDCVLQSQFLQSERRRPRAADVEKAVAPAVRAKIISWLVAAFDVLGFGSDLLFSTVLTFDRYCAAVAQPIEQASLGVALLAAICTEMKLENADTYPQGHWQRLLQHLCQGRCELFVILRMEHKLLFSLDFATGVPHSFTFFTGLTSRLRSRHRPDDSERWLDLGLFLLSVALLDLELQYRYSHAILAAAALSGSLGVCEAPPRHREAVLEDLAAYHRAPASSHSAAVTENTVLACEEELLLLWCRCSDGGVDDIVPHFAAVAAHFGTALRHEVSRLSPQERLAVLVSRPGRLVPGQEIEQEGEEELQ